MTEDPQDNDPDIACRLEVLPGVTALEKLESAAQFGFDGVSLPGRHLPAYVDDLRSRRRDLPLPLLTMSLGFSGSLVSPDPAVRSRCRDSLRRLFDLCCELGLLLVNMPPVLIEDNPVRLTDPGEHETVEAAQDALLLEQLPSMADEARARGLRLLLEPVNRYETDYLRTLAHAARLCERIDHDALGVTCDLFHMQIEELDPANAIREAGRWIRHVHVSENTRVEPGPGSLDFASVFRALREICYRGLIEVECRTLSGSPEEVLPSSVQFLREKWRAAASEAPLSS